MRDYRITSDPRDIDVAAAHEFLRNAYWSPDVPRAVIERAVANSLCFAAFSASRKSASRAW